MDLWSSNARSNFVARAMVAAFMIGIVSTARVVSAAQVGPGTIQGLASVPLRFEALSDAGGAGSGFLVRSKGYRAVVGPTGVNLMLQGQARAGAGAGLRVAFQDADPDAQAVVTDAPATRVNYLVGRDRGTWRLDVPAYEGVRYRSVYPGIDVVYHSHEGLLEFDFVVAPGADPGAVSLRFEGTSGLRVDRTGDLLVGTRTGALRLRRPVAYQEAAMGRARVAARYDVREDSRVGFALGAFDTSRPLVIDPVVGLSTYLGGDENDVGTDVALGPDGSIYVTGWTESTDLVADPDLDAVQAERSGQFDAFVMKLTPDADRVSYVTYLGGSGAEFEITRIAVDAGGHAYITGATISGDFPVTDGAFQTTLNGFADSFVAKLNPEGNELVYATYLGGHGFEATQVVTVNADGEAYITGYTDSANFPTTPQTAQPSHGGSEDVFVAILDPEGRSLLFSTFLGGAGDEFAAGHAVDGDGAIYLTGWTSSLDFPVTDDAFQPEPAGDKDAFLVRLGPTGLLLDYATYFGGSGLDEGRDVALGPDGTVYLGGGGNSPDLPSTSDAYQTELAGQTDAFLAAFDTESLQPVFVSYLGGSDGELVSRVAVDREGYAILAGSTLSADLPLKNDSTLNGVEDIYIAKFEPDGGGLAYSTYLGGSGHDRARGVEIANDGGLWVIGYTDSSDFPLRDAVQSDNLGGTSCDYFPTDLGCDAFLVRFDDLTAGPVRLEDSGDESGPGATETDVSADPAGFIGAPLTSAGSGPAEVVSAEAESASDNLTVGSLSGKQETDAASGADTPSEAAGRRPAAESAATNPETGGSREAEESEASMPRLSGRGEDTSRVPQERGDRTGRQALELQIIDYDGEGHAVISGRAPSDSRLDAYLDDRPVEHTVARSDGRWRLRLDDPVSPGLYRLRIDQIDERGAVIASVEGSFLRAEASLASASLPKVIVQPGDSLWRIARRALGEGELYMLIYETNKDRIRDPDLLQPGQVLLLPAKD